MEIDDQNIKQLKQKVTAAKEEFDLAVAFHELWKKAAYDLDLHSRFGVSYSTQGFRVVRTALRRELILALIRLWDTNKQAVRMQSIAAALQDNEVLEALTLDRVKHLGWPECFNSMKDDLTAKANQAIQLIRDYLEDGTRDTVLKNLKTLRDERLAHRQLGPSKASGISTADEEIERFYQDNSKLISILLGLVHATAYDPEDTAKVFEHFARCFWNGFQSNEQVRPK